MAENRQQMATAVYLAQLEANKGECKCKVCQILRKGNDQTVEAFLEPENKIPDLLARTDQRV